MFQINVILEVKFPDSLSDGQPARLVISNRTGRQAILCKSIIDCTPGAYVARLAGGVFTEIQKYWGAQFFSYNHWK